jgi:hypothetical protein
VSQINALISELLANLKHSVNTSNNEHLEIELRGNTHKQLHVEVVVEGFEGTSSGTTWDHVHHWSFNLKEISLSKEGTDEVNDLVADLENFLDMWVDNHVQIAVAIPSILCQGVLLNFMLSRKHMHAVGKELNDCGANRELSLRGTPWNTSHSNNITTTEMRVDNVEIASVVSSSSHDLNLCIIPLNVDEDKLGSSNADSDNTTCHRDRRALKEHSIFSC